MIDTGSAAVIGSVLLLAGTLYSTRSASRKGDQLADKSRQAEQQQVEQVAQQAVQVQVASFEDNLALTTYIRRQVADGVAEATEQMRKDREQDRRDLRDVQRILGNVYGRLERIRQAVREYIRQVHDLWGKGEQPPPVGRHLDDLLDEVDEDTWTRVRMTQMQEDRNTRAPDDYGN